MHQFDDEVHKIWRNYPAMWVMEMLVILAQLETTSMLYSKQHNWFSNSNDNAKGICSPAVGEHMPLEKKKKTCTLEWSKGSYLCLFTFIIFYTFFCVSLSYCIVERSFLKLKQTKKDPCVKICVICNAPRALHILEGSQLESGKIRQCIIKRWDVFCEDLTDYTCKGDDFYV